ncbi:MAG: hypothetical protein Q8S54_18005 [Bacteroidota bacterium]|nr:hypothetical protein [Odoribacter sp.]MDP3645064.1 hypothetical protein [Bacteroidota bacterium]
MNFEFSKADKKLVRQIIETGLQREFANGLVKMGKIIKDWELKGTSSQDAYYKLFKALKNFDKHIARRYDKLTGSQYKLIVASQLYDEVIGEDDLNGLSDEAKSEIISTSQIFREL